MAKDYTDARKYGTPSYRQLQLANNQKYQTTSRQLLNSGYALPSFQIKQESPAKYLGRFDIASPILTSSGGKDWSGNSYWDPDTYTMDEFKAMQANPNEIRALNQPGIVLIANGLGKMVGLAGTTLLNSTVGLLAGLTTGIGNAISGGSFTEGLWNNAITAGLEEFNKAMEDWMPNYYSLKELEGPWYENLFTANFIGDKVLKNMGFTIGAIGAAYLTGGLGIGTLLGKGLLALGAGARAAELTSGIANRFINGLISAAGEASIEAYNSVHDGMEKYNKELDQYYNTQALALRLKYQEDVDSGIAPEIAEQQLNQGLKQLELNVNKAQQEYMKTTTDNGNAVFGLNMGLLTLSNNLEFGRIMKGGWGTQSMLENAYKKGSKDVARTIDGKIIGNTVADDVAFGKAMALGKAGYTNIAEEPSKRLWATSAIKNAMSEGGEEGSQNLISSAALMLAQAKALKSAKDKGYIDYALDPNISDSMIEYSSALNKAWDENFGTAASAGWEEVALGALTGILGVPMVGKRKNGKLGLTWQGGFMEDYKDAQEGYERIDKSVDQLNKSIDPNKLKKTFQRAVANVAINQTQRQALFNDDHYIFKNAQLAGAVNTALGIRDGLDSGEAYRAMIEEMATNITDKDVEEYKQAIIAETGNKDALKGKTTDEIRQQLLGDFLKFNTLLNKVLDNHDKLSKDKKAKKLNSDAFEELLYSYSLALNMQERINQIEEDSLKLNLEDPIDKEKFERNSNDLRRLEEDRKFLNNRVKQALSDPKSFNKLIEEKNVNFQKGLIANLLKAQVEAVKNAKSMEDIAHTVAFLDEADMETVLEKAYNEGTDEVKQHIDNFRKFQDDAEIVSVALNNAFNNLELDSRVAIENSPEGLLMLKILQLLHINDKRAERGETDEDEYTAEQEAKDLEDFNPLAPENLQKLELYRLQIIAAINDEDSGLSDDLKIQLIQVANTIADSIGLTVDNIQLKAAVTDLFNALYQDLVLRDNIGNNMSIADGIILTIDTLERLGTLDPNVKQMLLDTLDELKDNEKLQGIKDIIKKRKDELEKQRREKEKRDAEEAEKKKKEAEEREKRLKEEGKSEEEKKPVQAKEGTNKYSLTDLVDLANQTANPKITLTDNVLKSGLEVFVGDKSTDRNAEFPNGDTISTIWNKLKLVKVVEKAFDPTSKYSEENRLKIKDQVKLLIEAVDKGFVIYDDGVGTFLKLLNAAMTDETLQWFTNYKGTGNPDNSNKKEEPTIPPKIDGEPQPGDFAGNQFKVDYSMLAEDIHILKPIPRGKWGVIDRMMDDGVRPQWFIDNILGRIFKDNPEVKLRFITSGKDIIYLALKEEDIQKYLPEKKNNISIVDTNDGRYVITGTMGILKKGNNKPIYDKLMDRLITSFNSNENKNKFYVDTELYTQINNYTAGEYIHTTPEKAHGTVNFVRDLLGASSLSINDLAFAVILGNEEEGITRPKLIRNKTDNIYYQPDSLNTGGVLIYIQSGIPNVWIPTYLKSVSWNDILVINKTPNSDGQVNPYLKDSTWYKDEIMEPINTLFSDAVEDDKVAAITKLRSNLLLNKKETGDGFKYSIRYDENSGTVQYFTNRKWTVANSPEELLKALETINPRISVNSSTLQNNPELYIDAGILLSDVVSLHTMKSTFYVKGLDDNLNVIEGKADMTSLKKDHPEVKQTPVYLDGREYFKRDDGVYYSDGTPLNDEDAERMRKLQAALNFGLNFKDETNDKEYIIAGDVVYEHVARGYVSITGNAAKNVIKRRDKLLQKQLLKQNRDEAESKKKKQLEEQPKPSIAATAVTPKPKKRDTKGFKPQASLPEENLGNSGNNDNFASIKAKTEVYVRVARTNDEYFSHIAKFLNMPEDYLDNLAPDFIAEEMAKKLTSDSRLTPENIVQITESSDDKISEILDNIINCH